MYNISSIERSSSYINNLKLIEHDFSIVVNFIVL